MLLRRFNLANIYIQVHTFHNGVTKESIAKFLIRNRFDVTLRVLSPKSFFQIVLKAYSSRMRMCGKVMITNVNTGLQF